MIKLTPKQWEVLERMEEGWWLHMEKSNRGSVLISFNVEPIRVDYRLARTLREKRAIFPVEKCSHGYCVKWAVTPAGRAALAARKAALAKGGA